MPEPTGDWQADLRELAHRQRAGLLRHPWVMEYAANRPPSGPNDARNLELMLGMVAGTGVDARMMMDILMTVVTYVMGAVLREVQEMRSERNRAEREAAMTADELEAEHERFHAVARDRGPLSEHPAHGRGGRRPGRGGDQGRALRVRPGLPARRHSRPAAGGRLNTSRPALRAAVG